MYWYGLKVTAEKASQHRSHDRGFHCALGAALEDARSLYQNYSWLAMRDLAKVAVQVQVRLFSAAGEEIVYRLGPI